MIYSLIVNNFNRIQFHVFEFSSCCYIGSLIYNNPGTPTLLHCHKGPPDCATGYFRDSLERQNFAQHFYCAIQYRALISNRNGTWCNFPLRDFLRDLQIYSSYVQMHLIG